MLTASVAACSAMIPVRISGSLEQPMATFGVDPVRPERVCVSSLAVHETSNAMMRPVWTVSARGRDCRKLTQVVYGQAPKGFVADGPAQALKPGVRYLVVGHGRTSWSAAVPWNGGEDFIFEDGQWRPAPPFIAGR
ncbi:hypothetical protein [Brevundimonas sp. NPDC046655]|uniref:hypothetical protein n=1 Tax=unclassified Brevundimonas TaxID=2622653 RepID=UPI00384D16BC